METHLEYIDNQSHDLDLSHIFLSPEKLQYNKPKHPTMEYKKIKDKMIDPAELAFIL